MTLSTCAGERQVKIRLTTDTGIYHVVIQFARTKRGEVLSNYKERYQVERDELYAKLDKLTTFLASKEMGHVSIKQSKLLQKQAKVMAHSISILDERLELLYG